MLELDTTYIIAFSAGIGFLALLFAIRNRIADTRTRVVVEHGYAHQLISEGSNFLPGTETILYVRVRNLGSTQRFIEKPGIWVSRKINGERVFYPVKIDDMNTYPYKLESGAEFKLDFNLNDFQLQIGRHLKDHDNIRFEVSDTHGGKFRSKKFSVKEFRDQIQVARDVDKGHGE